MSEFMDSFNSRFTDNVLVTIDNRANTLLIEQPVFDEAERVGFHKMRYLSTRDPEINDEKEKRIKIGKFDLGDLTMEFIRCVTQALEELRKSDPDCDEYELSEMSYESIFKRSEKSFHSTFVFFANTPVVAREFITKKSGVPPIQEGLIDFYLNLKQSVECESKLAVIKKRFKNQEIQMLGSGRFEEIMAPLSVLYKVKEENGGFGTFKSGVVTDNLSDMIEPRTFKNFFEYDESKLSMHIVYDVNNLMDLIALDYISFLASPTKTGTIGFCSNCHRIFRASRSDAIFCSQACGEKSKTESYSIYEKKYKYYVKRSTTLLPGDENKELRERWRKEAQFSLKIASESQGKTSPEELGKKLKHSLDFFVQKSQRIDKD